MSKAELNSLKERIDGARVLGEALLRKSANALAGVFPHGSVDPQSLSEPTEGVLHLIDRCLPGWDIVLHGQATEPNGHWNCILRESASSDDDAVVGTGQAPTVALAALEALLTVAAAKSRD